MNVIKGKFSGAFGKQRESEFDVTSRGRLFHRGLPATYDGGKPCLLDHYNSEADDDPRRWHVGCGH